MLKVFINGWFVFKNRSARELNEAWLSLYMFYDPARDLLWRLKSLTALALLWKFLISLVWKFAWFCRSPKSEAKHCAVGREFNMTSTHTTRLLKGNLNLIQSLIVRFRSNSFRFSTYRCWLSLLFFLLVPFFISTTFKHSISL